MEIRIAAKEDAQEIRKLLNQCRKTLEAQNIYQWEDEHLEFGVILGDIKRQALYTIREGGEIMGVVTLNEDQPAEYRTIDWEKPGKVLIVHRLAVHPDHQGKGIGSSLMDFAERYANVNGYHAIRLETDQSNQSSNMLYRKKNYVYKGQVFYPQEDQSFSCYEKVLQE